MVWGRRMGGKRCRMGEELKKWFLGGAGKERGRVESLPEKFFARAARSQKKGTYREMGTFVLDGWLILVEEIAPN